MNVRIPGDGGVGMSEESRDGPVVVARFVQQGRIGVPQAVMGGMCYTGIFAGSAKGMRAALVALSVIIQK
jgi:hypothetical protein